VPTRAQDKKQDQTEAAVADVIEKEQAKGYRGVEADPTPDEHYTVQGVLAGKPTPETDQDHSDSVAAYQRSLAQGKVTNG
jgi:hypothetical protein